MTATIETPTAPVAELSASQKAKATRVRNGNAGLFRPSKEQKRAALLESVRKHAESNKDSGNWSIVLTGWGPEELDAAVGGARTERAAVSAVEKALKEYETKEDSVNTVKKGAGRPAAAARRERAAQRTPLPETPKTAEPKWATHKGHGSPAVLDYYGDTPRKPELTGVRCTVEVNATRIRILDGEGNARDGGGVAHRFWAVPVPAEAPAPVKATKTAPAKAAPVKKAGRTPRWTQGQDIKGGYTAKWVHGYYVLAFKVTDSGKEWIADMSDGTRIKEGLGCIATEKLARAYGVEHGLLRGGK